MNLPLASASSGLEKKLISLVRKALHEFALIPNADPVAIALSGGKDSLTLLHLLAQISGRGFPPFPLIAIHISGPYTCGAGVDTQFLQTICRNLGVPLHIRPSTQKLETLSCYPCSRERRSLIFAAAKEAGARTIAFGHHQDDSAHTLLMNLLHKGEFAGLLPLIPMHHYGVSLIRPLIFADEEAIRAYAQQKGFARIVCRCPVGQTSMRQKVKQWMQDLEIHFPHAKQNFADAALKDGSKKAALPPKAKGKIDAPLPESSPDAPERLVE